MDRRLLNALVCTERSVKSSKNKGGTISTQHENVRKSCSFSDIYFLHFHVNIYVCMSHRNVNIHLLAIRQN